MKILCFICLLIIFRVDFSLCRQNPDQISRSDACNGTRYPQICIELLAPYKSQLIQDPSSACKLATKAIGPRIQQTVDLLQRSILIEKDATAKSAMEDCEETLGDALDYAQISASKMSDFGIEFVEDGRCQDVESWLSAILTDHTTCADGLESFAANRTDRIRKNVKFLRHELSNVLGLFQKRKRAILKQKQKGRKLNSHPWWMKSGQSRFLLDSNQRIDSVVALDGSGDFESIQAAVDAAPFNSSAMFVIYIKSGVYDENVKISKKKINLAFVGDGMDKTIITGSKNVQMPGVTTFRSATLAINGMGFVARDLTIRNTAGPEKHQAVAMRVSADRAVFYRCNIQGYQDTLYAHTHRQFYRECRVAGTVDFIFGNAAAVFQQCTLVAKLPLDSQKNTYTAQSRSDPLQNTGFSFHLCSVAVDPTAASVPTFLGRPWKDYSRTVFMQSDLGSHINPAGWIDWDPSTSYRNSTVFYGEFQNTGPGSNRSSRVPWSTALSLDQASQFRVGSFISGDQWLPDTGVAYTT